MDLKLLFSMLVLGCCISCTPHSDKEYLRKVRQKMDRVESVSYRMIQQTWEPGDSDPIYKEEFYVYEHKNPEDTAVGSSYLVARDRAFQQVETGYDGKVCFTLDRDEKEVWIDNFTRKRPVAFRLVMPKFFFHTRCILDYALTTADSVTLSLQDLGEDYLLSLTVHMPQQVEFFGKPCYMPENPYVYDPTSVYKVWISKATDLPYRSRQEMCLTIVEWECADFVFDLPDKDLIVAEDFYPEDYTLHRYGEARREETADMTGKQAPAWTLTDMNDHPVSLDALKSKVILLQLTGIGCGPCKVSIPFLRRLRNLYDQEALEIVAVETWGRKKSSCENYIRNFGINYRFLSGNEKEIAELVQNYQSGGGVPQFFVIDSERKIVKQISGYAEETTDRALEQQIERLLGVGE